MDTELNADEQRVADALAAAIARIDAVLRPWGFIFTADEVHYSHYGYYASGYYCREMTRIGLSFGRDTITNVFYQHSFVKEFAYCKEIERFGLRHYALMTALGHSEDCKLLEKSWDEYPDGIVARDGGDRVAALIDDLKFFAAPVLREPCEEFCTIMRTGFRGYSLSY